MAEYAGYRTTLEIELASVWTAVAQIVDLKGPSAEADQIEVTHRGVGGSGVNRFRRYVAGMVDGGEMTFDVIFDPDHASHDPTVTGSIYNLVETGVVNNFRITFPGVSTATTRASFAAFVSKFDVDSPLEDGLKADVTLKITGSITWAHIP